MMCFIPFGVFAAQGADVAFDERDGCFEFVADNGNKGVLDFFGIAELVMSRTVAMILRRVPSAASSGA